MLLRCNATDDGAWVTLGYEALMIAKWGSSVNDRKQVVAVKGEQIALLGFCQLPSRIALP